MAGTQDMANGDKIPFYWPNVRNLTKENFEFFEQRYKKRIISMQKPNMV